MLGPRRMISEIAKANPHVANDRAGHANRKSDAQDGVRDGQRIEVAVAQKEEARCETPDERADRQDRVGQVGERKDCRSRKRGSLRAARQAQEAQQEVALAAAPAGRWQRLCTPRSDRRTCRHRRASAACVSGQRRSSQAAAASSATATIRIERARLAMPKPIAFQPGNESQVAATTKVAATK